MGGGKSINRKMPRTPSVWPSNKPFRLFVVDQRQLFLGFRRWLLCLFWSFFGINSSFFTHSSEDDDIGILAVLLEQLFDLVTDITLWNLDVVLSRSVVRHKGEETVIGDIEKLIFLTTNIWNIHVVRGWAQIFELLAGEDVNGDKMDLGVAMLSSLGG